MRICVYMWILIISEITRTCLSNLTCMSGVGVTFIGVGEQSSKTIAHSDYIFYVHEHHSNINKVKSM